METLNAKDWKTQKRKDLNISYSETSSGSLGEVEGISTSYGDDSLKPSREDSKRGYPNIRGGIRSQEVNGKIIGALIEETENQLSYHRQQVQLLESRLKDLRSTSEKVEDIE